MFSIIARVTHGEFARCPRFERADKNITGIHVVGKLSRGAVVRDDAEQIAVLEGLLKRLKTENT